MPIKLVIEKFGIYYYYNIDKICINYKTWHLTIIN